MTGPDIRRLIDRSSLGAPDARLLRDSVSDETAQRVVARAAQLADWETYLDALQTNLDNAGCEVQLAASLTDRTAEIVLPDGSVVRLDADTLAGVTPSEVARRIVVRADDIREAIHRATPCNLWHCPTSGDVECGTHGGFDTCCDRTDLHQPIFTEHDYAGSIRAE